VLVGLKSLGVEKDEDPLDQLGEVDFTCVSVELPKVPLVPVMVQPPLVLSRTET
jgi:hypothetical protein